MAVDRNLEMSVELAKAHLANSCMEASELPQLIRKIYATLVDLSSPPQAAGVTDQASEIGLDRSTPPIINEDLSSEAFSGLDPWLASRIHQRTARRLNRQPSIHPSVFDDHLICLEDGEKVKLIRPYIRNRFGLDFLEYIDRWQLPDDYPAAPPSFLEAKRAAAKASGLGSVTRGKREGHGRSVRAGDEARKARNPAKT